MRLSIAIFCLLLSVPSWADEYDVAEEAYNAGDYAKAFPIFEALAVGGYDEAQASLGIMYARGYGVPADENAAVEWWVKAADQGNNRAQGYLGDLFSDENSELRDYQKAIEYYKLSAVQGDDISQAKLGYMYAEGLGVEVDLDVAFEWWEMAAKSGNEAAQKNLERARELNLYK